jgi:hypothetical protein
LHSLMVTGTMRSIVVTLSRNADTTAVNMHKIRMRRQLWPPASLYAFTAHLHSNKEHRNNTGQHGKWGKAKRHSYLE